MHFLLEIKWPVVMYQTMVENFCLFRLEQGGFAFTVDIKHVVEKDLHVEILFAHDGSIQRPFIDFQKIQHISSSLHFIYTRTISYFPT